MHILILLLSLFLLSHSAVSQPTPPAHDRWYPAPQAVELMLDALWQGMQGNANLGLVSYESSYGSASAKYFPVHAIACFKYQHSDESIIVNYFSHPLASFELKETAPGQMEKIVSPITYAGPRNPIDGVARSQQPPDWQTAKQITIPMPPGLKKAVLLNNLYRDEPHYTTKDGWVQIAPKSCHPFSWGFKHWGGDLSEFDSDYMVNPLGLILAEVLIPIRDAIMKNEMPEDWEKDFENYQSKRLYLLPVPPAGGG